MIQYPTFPSPSSRRGRGLPFNGLAAALAILCFLIGVGLQIATHQIGFAIVGAMVGALILLSLKMCNSWQRALVLRAGKIQGLRGPGLFLIIPFVD